MRDCKNILTTVAVVVAALTLSAQQPSGGKRSSDDQTSVSKIVLPQYAATIPPGPNVETYRNDCLTCHSARYVTMQPKFSRTVWEKEVKKMVDAYGASVPEADQQKIVDYLVAVRGAKAETPAASVSGSPK